MNKTQPTDSIRLKQLFQLVQFHTLSKPIIALVLILTLIETTAGLIVPLVTKDLVDVMTQQSFQLSILWFLLAAFVLQGVSAGISTYYLAYLGETVVANVRKRIWSHILHLPIRFFDQHRFGESISRVNNDTAVIKSLITEQLVTVFSGLISFFGAIGILLYLDWTMTVVMLTAVPLIFLIMRPIGKQMRIISHRLQEKTADFTNVLGQVVSEIRLVKAYAAEPMEAKNGEQEIDDLFRFGLKESRIYAILQPLMTFVMMLMLVIVIGYGGYRVATGLLSAGELVAFILYLFQIIMPLTAISRFFTTLQKAKGAGERIISILNQKPEPQGTNEMIQSTLPIHINNLTFAYQEEPVLKGISLTIAPKKMTAIVGLSGSGKTTLFSLLERFYEPTDGTICLGDTPIHQFSLRSWRTHISYVSQESPLLAGTIRDNIAYAVNRPISDDELQLAIQQAYADEFIQQLPDGLETEVGERGIKLSGGQRQRIAIARAILHNPSILMLDEATSNLDSQSEQIVQDALHNLMKERTTIVIAHRLSTVIDADQIIMLDKGTVTGKGTHTELLKNHPLYQQLVKQQLKWESIPQSLH